MISRSIGIAVGLVMIVVGALWTFQGLGVIGGSGMSGVETWAIVGPIVAGLGLALIAVVVRPRR